VEKEHRIAVLEWEYEYANSMAGVIERAIETGADAARDALEAFQKISIRGYTINLQAQIRAARALAHQVAV